jgi:hypothetical protein
MGFVFYLVLLALASLGQSKSTVGKRDTGSDFGLTEANIKTLVDGHNQRRGKVDSKDMYMLVSIQSLKKAISIVFSGNFDFIPQFPRNIKRDVS